MVNSKIYDFNYEEQEVAHSKSNIKVECEMSNGEKKVFNVGTSFVDENDTALNSPSPFVTDRGFGVHPDEIEKITSVITNTKKFDIIFNEQGPE